MTLLPYPEGDALDGPGLAEAIQNRETPFGDYMGAQFQEGLWATLPGQGLAQIQADPEGFDRWWKGPSSREDFRARLRAGINGGAQPLPEGVKTLSEEEWKASPNFRKKLAWDGGMTESRAKAMADIHDDNAYRRWLIEQSPTGLRSIAGFGAAMAGGALDPVNYIPIFGPATRAAAVGRFSAVAGERSLLYATEKGVEQVSRFGMVAGNAAVQSAEAAIGTAATQPFLLPSRREFGDDVGMADAALDVAMGAAFGAVFGGGTGLYHSLKLERAMADVRTVTQANQALNVAVGDLANGRAVDVPAQVVDPVAARVKSEVEDLRTAVRDVDASPKGDPWEPLVELNPEGMKQIMVARGGFKNINELEVSKRGWGLVKVIWKHGWRSKEPDHLKVTEDDILALPQIVRSFSLIENEALPNQGMTWIVERNHPDFGTRRVLYGTNSNVRGRSGETLVTVHVIDPKDRKWELGVSKEKTGAPPASSSLAGNPPGDTAARSSQSATQGQAGTPATGTIPQSAVPDIPDMAITTTGRRVPVKYEVVDAAKLVTSHDDALAVNPAFPADLQPRDRARAASAAQIADMAGSLDPERLGRSVSAADGAPIVGGDHIVESGNGRVLAIRRAYAEGRGESYRQWLAAQGYDIAGMEQPVLIRRREGDLSPQDRAAFTREANDRTTLGESATERAMADARALPDHALDHYQGGDIDSAANGRFVRAFLDAVSPAERAAMMTADGKLSQDGARRIRSALLAKAYDEPGLVASLMESTDTNIKAIGDALLETAPAWIKLRAAVKAGDVAPTMDQTTALLRAVGIVRQARDTKMKVKDLADQLDLFDPHSAEVRGFLHLMYGENLGRAVSAQKLGVALGRYVDEAMLNLATPRLFGDALSAQQILSTVRGVKPADFSKPAEAAADPRVKDAADSAARPAGNVQDMAREMGLDLRSGDFDEKPMFDQLAAEGRLLPEEANAVRLGDEAMAKADGYADAYEAAASCMMRKAA